MERNTARRALSHVGGAISFRGDDTLRRVLERALGVTSDEERTRAHVHGFHSYPARLHPETARTLIAELSDPKSRVLDPFCGSGTVLVEAQLLGRVPIGTDVNPLGIALARQKARKTTEAERAELLGTAQLVAERAEERRQRREPPTRRYGRQDRELFEIHVLLELDGLQAEINEVRARGMRETLFIVLSAVLTKVSRRHGDSSRRMSERRLSSGTTIQWFVERARDLCKRLEDYANQLPPVTSKLVANVDDARVLKSVRDDSVDLVVTSPPYPGVYDYYEHHAARLRWLGIESGSFQRMEIGSRRQLNALLADEALANWEKDLTRVFRALARVVRRGKYVCLIMADSAVGGRAIQGDVTVSSVADRGSFELCAVASQPRPQFHRESLRAFRGKQRREHLLVLQRR